MAQWNSWKPKANYIHFPLVVWLYGWLRFLHWNQSHPSGSKQSEINRGTETERYSNHSGCQVSNSTASKTSDENVELTKTLSSIALTLSSPQTLSRLKKLLSEVGLMTMMRGTVWGDRETLSEALPRFRESKESLLWLANLLRVPLLSLAASEMSLVRLWLRLLVRTSRGRVAMVRDLDTSSCSQVLNDSFMADGCWWYKRKRKE